MKIIAKAYEGSDFTTYDSNQLAKDARVLAKRFHLVKPITWHIEHKDGGSLKLVSIGADGIGAEENL